MSNLRILLSFIAAEVYQRSWRVMYLPVISTLWMDLWWWLCRTLYPEEVAEGCMAPTMVEVIRRRMGVSEEEFWGEIEKVKQDSEREEVGLPPTRESR